LTTAAAHWQLEFLIWVVRRKPRARMHLADELQPQTPCRARGRHGDFVHTNQLLRDLQNSPLQSRPHKQQVVYQQGSSVKSIETPTPEFFAKVAIFLCEIRWCNKCKNPARSR
jgi:hypothetical protein